LGVEGLKATEIAQLALGPMMDEQRDESTAKAPSELEGFPIFTLSVVLLLVSVMVCAALAVFNV
jgi:hypothetical protein